ncbi:PREDICTED: protein FAR-RED ELONGATED HYPOCOTYL 1-like [Tarenaya hassleriana]|uniref:protein FAR-RED ELONGATED HYPOCOTYL 1-like n=1 Tax=Tarenaya hassleriana TaxID=28532 RepID=UPI00053C6115|nr:PREDICTED: protein FAR-RED ELONGATED HYPOCOTYL 1-like [Tarenaya hassleriana]
MSDCEVDNQNPSQITRCSISNNVLNMEAVNLSRKRKFQTEQLELLPLPKHVCFDENKNKNSSDPSPEVESVKDSNSFATAEGSDYSTLSVNSGSMECSNEIKSESSSSSLGESMLQNPIEGYIEKDIVDFLYPDEDVKDYNATYVLSSGRWTVNQDSSRQNTRKPTIDQEFEQYFSMLML